MKNTTQHIYHRQGLNWDVSIWSPLLIINPPRFPHHSLAKYREMNSKRKKVLSSGRKILHFIFIFWSYLVSHEPPDIQNDPSSDLYLRSMRCTPAVLLSVHVTCGRRPFDTWQPRAKVNLEGQRPFQEKSPREHLYLITNQNVGVPFTDDSDQSSKEVLLFSNILDFLSSDSWSRQQRSKMRCTDVLRCW